MVVDEEYEEGLVGPSSAHVKVPADNFLVSLM